MTASVAATRATAPAPPERVADNLNRALHAAFAADPDLVLLGEDVLDPYGGAFRITRGLSAAYPGRVLTTPISEGAIVGFGAGLALAGRPAIVEIMFGDFVALGFDQLVNFASKSVSMYGRHVPVPLVVRCPVGGGRGYGPTHSQSLQKHFVGVPNLALYELSPFVDARDLLAGILARRTPALLFEDKGLYTRRMFRDGQVDDVFGYELRGADGGLAWVRPRGLDQVDALIVAPGGVCHRALSAARTLLLTHDLVCQVVVPTRLYPVEADPLVRFAAGAGVVVVVEESTAGGTWGAEVAHALHERLWSRLRRPVRLVHSADAIIPTAAHLERAVLVQEQSIVDAVRMGVQDE